VITQEMMIDTAYTLAHNNGPMFNKGMLYDHYGNDFKKILDVQRSGQIPEFILEGGAKFLTPLQSSVFNDALTALKGEFGNYVDWYQVEKLGSLIKYPVEKTVQDKKYGNPAISTKLDNFNGHDAKQIGVFDIAPGVALPVLERVS